MVLLNLTSKGYPKQHDFEINYDVPLEFSSNSEIALKDYNIWYSWRNVSDEYNTNKLKYFDGKEWKIIFPEVIIISMTFRITLMIIFKQMIQRSPFMLTL
jgi:hypothetical protein